MADKKHWFKVWNTILTDPSIQSLSLEDIGRWVLLTSLTSQHGQNGVLSVPEEYLKRMLRCNGECNDDISRLPNLEVEKCNDEKSVTYSIKFRNWYKYQIDNSAPRVAKYRQSVTKNKNKNKNIYTNTKNIEENVTEAVTVEQPKTGKHKHGSHNNILLTAKEFASLSEKLGADEAKRMIEVVSEGIALHGYKYKSHYLAILKWYKNEANRLPSKAEDEKHREWLAKKPWERT